ncbi:MAG: DUF177 domain-containing protein [Burkholderiales bacterium]|nr:DUF177 domain-containing protein [Burkholderiales bacterium]
MLTQTLSALAFATSGQNLRGSIEVSALHRLHDQLHLHDQSHDHVGSVAYSITGSCIDGKPNLNVSVAGTLSLRCERCLEPFAYTIAISSNLAPVQDALPDLMDEDDDVESIPAEENIDVIAFIEEEILLSLPISPRHETNICSAVAGAAVEREQRLAGLGQLSALIKKSK